jgi:hypothetical protein
MASRKCESSSSAAAVDTPKRRADVATDVEIINPHLVVPPLLPPPPAVDRVLLRRAFFINPERTKYASVGFYSSQNYEPYLEIGGARLRPIILSQQDVTTLAERLPDLCQAMYRHEQYAFSDGMFRLTTTRGYKTARITYDKHYISFKLDELRYLSNTLYMLQNQLTYYTLALPDLLNYVAKALPSTVYVEPSPDASNFILYYQLFDELKSLV